jgi:hypothetical protein
MVGYQTSATVCAGIYVNEVDVDGIGHLINSSEGRQTELSFVHRLGNSFEC